MSKRLTPLEEEVAWAIKTALIRTTEWSSAARAAIEIYIAELAKDGYVIHRFHIWRPEPVYAHPATRVCSRCGAREDGLLAAASCTPQLAEAILAPKVTA